MTDGAKVVAAALVLASALAVACGSGDGGEGRARPLDPEARRAAEQIFKERCARCHGATGDGAGRAVLGKRAQDYHDREWRASVQQAEVEKAIVEGGAAVGKSADMPPNPDLRDRPEVVRALRELVNEMGAD